MSAIVCGKRSFFEELPTNPLVSKKLRFSSTSPTRFSPPRSNSPTANSNSSIPHTSVPPSDNQSINSPVAAALDRLLAIFPEMDKKAMCDKLAQKAADLALENKNMKQSSHFGDILMGEGKGVDDERVPVASGQEHRSENTGTYQNNVDISKSRTSPQGIWVAAWDTSGVLVPLSFSRRNTEEDDVAFKVLFCGICRYDLQYIKNE